MKRLFLVRHAARDTFDRSQDNGLNEKGKRQAEALVGTLGDRLSALEKSGGKLAFVSSPKTRCMQTLTPCAERFKLAVKPELRLDERASDEDARHFAGRIKSFFEAWKSGQVSLVACSHGDLIPWLMELVSGQATDFEKATWAEIELHPDGSAKVLSIHRTPG